MKAWNPGSPRKGMRRALPAAIGLAVLFCILWAGPAAPCAAEEPGVAACASHADFVAALEDSSIHTISLTDDLLIEAPVIRTVERAVLVDMGDYSIRMGSFCGVILTGPITFRGAGALAPLFTVGFRQVLLLDGGTIEATADGAVALHVAANIPLNNGPLRIRTTGSGATAVRCDANATLTYLDIEASGENSIGVYAEENITISLSSVLAQGTSLHSQSGTIRAQSTRYSPIGAAVEEIVFRAECEPFFVERGSPFTPPEEANISFIHKDATIVYPGARVEWNTEHLDLETEGIYRLPGRVDLPFYDLPVEGFDSLYTWVYVYDPDLLLIAPTAYFINDYTQGDYLLLNLYPPRGLKEVEAWVSADNGETWVSHEEINVYKSNDVSSAVELIRFRVDADQEYLIFIKGNEDGVAHSSNILPFRYAAGGLQLCMGGDRNGLDRDTENFGAGTGLPGTSPGSGIDDDDDKGGNGNTPGSDTATEGREPEVHRQGAPLPPPDAPVSEQAAAGPTTHRSSANIHGAEPPALETQPEQAHGEEGTPPAMPGAVVYTPTQLRDFMEANPFQVTFMQEGLGLTVPTEALEGLFAEGMQSLAILTGMRTDAYDACDTCGAYDAYIEARAFAGGRELTDLGGTSFILTFPYPAGQGKAVSLHTASGGTYTAHMLQNGRAEVALDCFGGFHVQAAALAPAPSAIRQQQEAKPVEGADGRPPYFLLAAGPVFFAAGLAARLWAKRARS